MGKYLGGLLSVLVGAGVVVAMVMVLGSSAKIAPAVSATSNSDNAGFAQHVTITLQTFPNNPYEDPGWVDAHKADYGGNPPAPGDNQDWVTYWPNPELTVPAHSLVTVKIQNYDGATPLLNPFYAVPHGVVDERGNTTDSMDVDGNAVNQVEPEDVSHTFTIHSIADANSTWLFVSVPVTAVPDDAKTDDFGMPLQPVTTTFSFITGDPGNYIWQCFDPCGAGFNGFGGPMSTKGYMSGTLTVV